MNIFNPNL